MTYESIFLEYHDKVVIEPINDILISSMFEELHIERMVLVSETCKNQPCVIKRYVFGMMEVTFSDSRVYVEGCRREPDRSSRSCFLKKFSNFNLSVDVP